MKKFLIYVSALSLLGSLPVSANDETEETWAVYWYLCGSDLESQYGCATEDLSEMLEVSLPENVTVVVETGGATEWQNETVDPLLPGALCLPGRGAEFCGFRPFRQHGGGFHPGRFS